jgi:adenylyltransferase/sulfurtransferase
MLSLCGRNAVQVLPSAGSSLDLKQLAHRLSSAGEVKSNEFMVTLTLPEHTLSVFPDGRTLIRGTDDLAQARSLYDRFIGS